MPQAVTAINDDLALADTYGELGEFLGRRMASVAWVNAWERFTPAEGAE
jgi:hypothetical protein